MRDWQLAVTVWEKVSEAGSFLAWEECFRLKSTHESLPKLITMGPAKNNGRSGG